MINKHPKILFYDVETPPFKVYTHYIGRKVSIKHTQIIPPTWGGIICICWKWRSEKKVHSLDWGYNKQSSKTMVRKFSKILQSANIVIAHNGKKFDNKKINTQLLLYGERPIDWPVMEDTLTQFRRFFDFPSYRLDYLAKTLTGRGKDKVAYDDWINIVEKKSEASFNKMIRYCKQDVRSLEGVFEKAEVFFKPVINASLISGNGRWGCPRCGTNNVRKEGRRVTTASVYHRLHCNVCGTWFKGPVIREQNTKRFG